MSRSVDHGRTSALPSAPSCSAGWRRLRASGLEAVLAVAASELRAAVRVDDESRSNPASPQLRPAPNMPPTPASLDAAASLLAAASTRTASPHEKSVDSLRLLGVVPPGRCTSRWANLSELVRRTIPRVACAVLTARHEWQRGDGQVRTTEPLEPSAAREELMASYSRAAGPPLRRVETPPELLEAAAAELGELAAALAVAAKAALAKNDEEGGGAAMSSSMPVRLDVVAFAERPWACWLVLER